MLDEHIEAVFENGVFRPLEPVHLPEHQRVTLVLPATNGDATNGTPAEADARDEEVGYQPLPLRDCQTIRVRVKQVGDFGPLPYPAQLEESEEE